MIERLRVIGLNNSIDDIDIKFNSDLNVLVGANGCGKTTILKLIWYVYSGNFLSLSRDIKFKKIELYVDSIIIEVNYAVDKRSRPSVFYFDKCNNELKIDPPLNDKDDMYDLMYSNHNNYLNNGQSLFFPTFRRIEGGYSLNDRMGPRRYNSFDSRIADDLDRLSDELSKPMHKFIVGISTKDINHLISNKVAEIGRQSDKAYQLLSKNIEEKISNTDLDSIELEEAKKALLEISKETKKTQAKSIEYNKPYSELQKLVSEFFTHKGIKISEDIFLGENTDLLSEYLSAGEKQMLSFLAYNAFYDKTTFFIDEPELSLHGDWQRSLFPKLLKQKKNNQFIIATHSPFIYANYPDKEIIIGINRGE